MNHMCQHLVHAFPINKPHFQDSSHNHGKFSWGLIMIFLLTQVIAAQDQVTTVNDFVSVRNSTERSPPSFTISNIVETNSTDSSWPIKSVDEVPYLTNHSKKLKLNSNETDSVPEIINEAEIDTISLNSNHHKREISEQVKDNTLGNINLVHLDLKSFITLHDTNATELEKEDRAYTEDLDIVLNSIQNLSKNLKYLKENNRKLLKYAEKSCISQIATGKIDEAVEVFKDFKDDLGLSQIIKSVYTEFGGNAKIVNILDFTDKLGSCSQFEIAYNELFKVISDWNNVSNEVLFLFYGQIADHSVSCSSLSNLKNNLEFKVYRIIIRWSCQFTEHKDDVYKQIVDYAKKPKLAPVISSRLLPLFIEEVYNKVPSNTESIMKFIDGLPHIEQSVASYSALYDRLRSSPEDLKTHQLQLAYKVKKLMEKDGYCNIDQLYKDKSINIKDSLPSSVRGLVWNGRNCTVLNRKFNEYLFASAKLYHSNARYVNTRISRSVEIDSYWEFITQDEGKSFAIRNVKYNRYLYTSNDVSFSSQDIWVKHFVFLYMPENDPVTINFKLELTDSSGFFKIIPIHLADTEYLYSDNSNKLNDNERYAFTRKAQNLNNTEYWESDWAFSC